MPIERNPDLLDPFFKNIVYDIMQICRDSGVPIRINETVRSQEVQSAYFAQGRMPLKEVNELRAKAGLYPISESENQKIITNTPFISKEKGHGAGLAVDVVPIKSGWNASSDEWNVIGIAVDMVRKRYKKYLDEQGLDIVWGGVWKLKDYPHIELIKKENKQ